MYVFLCELMTYRSTSLTRLTRGARETLGSLQRETGAHVRNIITNIIRNIITKGKNSS